MSDEESDDEIWIDPSREEEIGKDVSSNLEVLNSKTINFEDLLNELVRRGCLSFEEKFKILSGIVDETTANKTIPEKCNELYQTLIRKKIPWAKVLKCWEETGNGYLVGRFDTHFTIEGRDSKSLKFSKFKALPSNRTEFLTHLFLKNVQLSPKSLLKCLKKSSRLQSIRLERVKVPHGGRLGDDPSIDFDLPLLLPNLKDFYFEEVTKQELFQSVKEVNMYLDELNLKPMIFFGLNSNMAWDVGIWICVKVRGVTILKMEPPAEEAFQNQSDAEDAYGEYISMLRRRPAEYGGFINPKICPRVSLYECYLPKIPFPPNLTHLTLYRCRVADFHPMISSCPNLIRVSVYGDYETNNVAQFDFSSLSLSRGSLKHLSIGMIQVNQNVSPGEDGSDASLNLSLDSLCIDCCKFEENVCSNFNNIFKTVKNISIVACNLQVIESFCKNDISQSISVCGFSSQSENESGNDGDLKEIISKSLKGKDEGNFVLEKKDGGWTVKKSKLDMTLLVFEQFGWDIFCEKSNSCKGWFDLTFKKTDENDTENPRGVFRKRLNF